MRGRTFKVERLEAWEIRTPFRGAFRHAAAERRESHALIIAISAAGKTGYGEILPRPYLTGETIGSAQDDVRHRYWPMLTHIEFDERLPYEALSPLYEEADARRLTASYAGVDVAIFDLWARIMGIPGHSMLGRKPPALPLVGVIGMGRHAAFKARALKLLGCRELKLKIGGGGAAQEAALVNTLSRQIGAEMKLRVDANAAWSEAEAKEFLSHVDEAALTSIEEPIKIHGAKDLAAVSQFGTTIVADECLCTQKDAQQLIAAGVRGEWNLRLGKVGGFSGVMALAKIADLHGISCQLGALVGESSILGAAQRAAMAIAPFSRAEAALSGWLLKRDPFRQADRRGTPRGVVLSPLKGAHGLGVEPECIPSVESRIVLYA